MHPTVHYVIPDLRHEHFFVSGNVANNNIEHLNVRGGAHFGIGDFNKNDWH